MNVPPSWNRMGFCAKAAYLVYTHQAKDYSDACSMLARARKPKRPIKPGRSVESFWWNK